MSAHPPYRAALVLSLALVPAGRAPIAAQAFETGDPAARIVEARGPLEASAAAAEPPPWSDRSSEETDGSSLTVYLVTMGPGRRVWERFGHNAIWVRDTVRGIDRLYNYGMFSFRQESFLIRFVRGRMLYWMEGFEGAPHLGTYAAADRSIKLQELALRPDQRAELYAFLEWNERPENRFYRYDYYRDNCSTRVRDALDRVLTGRLREVTANQPTGTTYRFHTRRLLAADPLAYAGTLFSLGRSIERPISAWEEMFLPVPMMERLRSFSVPDGNGGEKPLVVSEATLHESGLPPPPDAPPDWRLPFLAIGTAVALSILAALAGRRSRWLWRGGLTVGSLWAAVSGLCGLFMILVWAFTEHWAAYWNVNLFYLSPAAAPLAVLAPLASTGRVRAARWAIRCAYAVVGLSALGLVAELFPFFRQVNAEIVLTAVPPNLALAWVVRRSASQGGRSAVSLVSRATKRKD